MRRAVSVLFLMLMGLGLLITGLGTRTSTQISYYGEGPVCNLITGCLNTRPSYSIVSADFTLNHVGGFLAILSAISFVIVLPSKRRIGHWP